ncbi:MAG TPA: nickel pincer cofactor biosynthesis protein LarB [Longimicrobiales bacterium]
MRRDQLRRLLEAVAAGGIAPDAALEKLAWTPVEAVDEASEGAPFARIDHHRAIRNGYPEVVFCSGKTVPQVVAICERLAARGGGFLATRAAEPVRAALAERFPAAEVHDLGRIVYQPPDEPLDLDDGAPILVVSAGTSDLPVAEEAAVTARAMGLRVERLYDVGVAGIHRLLGESEALARAAVILVVAGMEGALPSVVGGLVPVPVIAVPTSVGYGAAFGGLAALLGMLNSCASGLLVVNIDNGFGAACAAARIVHARSAAR